MSKAFTKESDQEDEFQLVPRTTVPPGVTNYITAAGAERLRAELAKLTLKKQKLATASNSSSGSPNPAARKLEAQIRQLREILGSIVVAEPPPVSARNKVRFGATVTVRHSNNETTTYRIVGLDESDPDHERISWLSPLARQLLSRTVGDRIRMKLPAGEEEIQILQINYEET